MDKEVEFEWFDLAEVNEIIVLDLNEAVITLEFDSNSVIVEDSFKERQPIEVVRDGLAKNITIDDYVGREETVDIDSRDDVGNNNAWDAGLDDYESGDDSGSDSDMLSDYEVQDACNIYEANSGGFEFNMDGERIMLRVGAVYRNVDECRKVVKVFAIQIGFRLKRVKNEKSRVTLTCAAVGCTWRVHASPNWNGKHFQIKTFRPEHICARGNDNYKANSTWIAATFLHLFRANPQLNIEVIASELFRRFGIKCSNQRLYRAKNKALELLGQDIRPAIPHYIGICM